MLPIDGVAGLRRRQATASRYLSGFGVAMYCGFGRQPGADGTETTTGPVYTSSDSGPISQYSGSASSPPANGIP